MKAIVEIKGKQYSVEAGRYLEIDRMEVEENSQVTLDNVCFVDNGTDLMIGQPYVAGAKVVGKIMRHYRGPKLLIYKMRCKKGYRRKNGHRQQYTQLMVEAVNLA